MLSRLASITRHFSSTTASSSTLTQPQKYLMAAKDFVEDSISSTKITVFSKTHCPYCRRAKALFADKYADSEITIVELDERDDGSAMQDYLQSKTGQRTVPHVFINQQFIGGCDDTMALERSGKLSGLVRA